MAAMKLQVLLGVAVVLGATSAHADKPAAAKTGAAMCVLAPADFKAVGITNADKPKANVSEGGASSYCAYTAKSSAAGGLELDVFCPAGGNDTEVKATEDTAVGEMSGKLEGIKLAGADSARWTGSAKSGGPEFAVLVVRRGKLVFVLGIPAHKDAKDRLVKLGALVLARLAT
jgi:hypothetical protein